MNTESSKPDKDKLFYHNLVAKFHNAFQVKRYGTLAATPKEVLNARITLIKEELEELENAKTPVDKLDAICDIIYVLVGTGDICGIPIKQLCAGGSPVYFNMYAEAFCENIETFKIPCKKHFSLYGDLFLECAKDLALASKFKLNDAFIAVHENNMEKLWTEKPTEKELVYTPVGDKFLVRRADGKIMKPKNHKKVDLTPYV